MFFLHLQDVTTAANTALAADFTDASATVTFTMNDATMTVPVTLTADTVLEDFEYLDFTIAVTSDATTMMYASVSANAKSAKIFIIDRSSEYNIALESIIILEIRNYKNDVYNVVEHFAGTPCKIQYRVTDGIVVNTLFDCMKMLFHQVCFGLIQSI
jgi:hypothetical protein